MMRWDQLSQECRDTIMETLRTDLLAAKVRLQAAELQKQGADYDRRRAKLAMNATAKVREEKKPRHEVQTDGVQTGPEKP